ncbi:MAG: deoxyhypusine synthase [Planctomycetia bacterium]|nr:deoxyhypusine synthase [Planctomycetia bacterium]
MPTKTDYLHTPVEHLDITEHNVVGLVEAMNHTAFSARDLARAADITDRMICDKDCGIILCLAGSLISAGMKKVFVDALRCNMVDAIVSTGANIVDQDFFEALGFRHYVGEEKLRSGMFDAELRELAIDRIYDTLIDEEELRVCDETTRIIADELEARPHSSREFIRAMGEYLPIFCPAFSDCSAGFGLVAHQHSRGDGPKVAIDSAKDFYELTQLKIQNPTTGLFMVGGGVPKNFAQDIVVAADILGKEAPMHKYAIQITVADARDGALSGSTLKEASSWGKVDLAYEQMVYSEATLALPLILGFAYHKGNWRTRQARRWSRLLEPVTAS